MHVMLLIVVVLQPSTTATIASSAYLSVRILYTREVLSKLETTCSAYLIARLFVFAKPWKSVYTMDSSICTRI